MKIQDARGRTIPEVTLQLQGEEVTDLMVAASQLEEGSVSHAIVRDQTGNAVALYKRSEDLEPLDRQVDWWLGPLILIAVILVVIGAITIVRSVIGLLF